LFPEDQFNDDIIQHKSHRTKFMGTAVIGRPTEANKGMIAFIPHVNEVVAQRSSIHRPRGTIDYIPYSLTAESFYECQIEENGVIVETGSFERHGKMQNFRFASIQFLHSESAKEALFATNGTVNIGGIPFGVAINRKKKLHRHWGELDASFVSTKIRPQTGTIRQQILGYSTLSLHIRFYALDEPVCSMSEELLREVFAPFEPFLITLKSEKGYCFLDFENNVSGIERAKELQDKFGGGLVYYYGILMKVEFSKNFIRVLQNMHMQQGDPSVIISGPHSPPHPYHHHHHLGRMYLRPPAPIPASYWRDQTFLARNCD
jgi:hypothetical protein